MSDEAREDLYWVERLHSLVMSLEECLWPAQMCFNDAQRVSAHLRTIKDTLFDMRTNTRSEAARGTDTTGDAYGGSYVR